MRIHNAILDKIALIRSATRCLVGSAAKASICAYRHDDIGLIHVLDAIGGFDCSGVSGHPSSLNHRSTCLVQSRITSDTQGLARSDLYTTLGRLLGDLPGRRDCRLDRHLRSLRYGLSRSTCSSLLGGMAGNRKSIYCRRDGNTENNMTAANPEGKQIRQREGEMMALLACGAERLSTCQSSHSQKNVESDRNFVAQGTKLCG